MKNNKEEYVVKFTYKKDDGFYTTKTESVFVEEDLKCPKCGHEKAENIIKSLDYRDLNIISVTYC